ncbi:MAG: chorismate mutase [Candidatus Hodarchaeaceae archaeon]|nr:chorismate mutase [Candidatus Hodarchaeaceae archaeon]
MSDKKLQGLRQEIDKIDEQLISLLAQRLKLADELASLKRKLKLGVRDEARERAIIDRVRKRARELKMDPTFAEDVWRLVMAQMTGEERERLGAVGMWSRIQKAFEEYPAQLSVARILFKYGLRVREDGEIACGDIRIPAVQIAKEAGVDRRVIDATAQRILKNRELYGIFGNLEPLAYLKGVAQQLGLGVIEILPEDAAKPGIIKEVTSVISKFGISIRQAVADDPYFVPQPKLTLITDEPVRGTVIDALRKIPSVRSVIVY